MIHDSGPLWVRDTNFAQWVIWVRWVRWVRDGLIVVL